MTHSKTETLVLSSTDINNIVHHYGLNSLMDTIINKLSVGFSSYNSQYTSIPVRSGFNYKKPHTGLIEWMPLYNQGENIVIKVVGYHPANPNKHNLPTIVSSMSSYDTETGQLIALVDGAFATALRTGAASAVASQHLAREDSSTLGLIGCGVQSITQLHAISRIFNLKKVLFYDTDPKALNSFVNRCKVLEVEADFILSSIEEIAASSEILCTATSIGVGEGPLFSNLETNPRLHINAVGSDFPGKIEIPLDLLKKSFVCPDFKEQAVVEGECQQLNQNDIDADIIEVVQNPELFQHIKNEISIFDSTGWALEDHIVMEMFLECASKLEIGRRIKLDAVSQDVKNPYDFLKVKTQYES